MSGPGSARDTQEEGPCPRRALLVWWAAWHSGGCREPMTGSVQGAERLPGRWALREGCLEEAGPRASQVRDAPTARSPVMGRWTEPSLPLCLQPLPGRRAFPVAGTARTTQLSLPKAGPAVPRGVDSLPPHSCLLAAARGLSNITQSPRARSTPDALLPECDPGPFHAGAWASAPTSRPHRPTAPREAPGLRGGHPHATPGTPPTRPSPAWHTVPGAQPSSPPHPLPGWVLWSGSHGNGSPMAALCRMEPGT